MGSSVTKQDHETFQEVVYLRRKNLSSHKYFLHKFRHKTQEMIQIHIHILILLQL